MWQRNDSPRAASAAVQAAAEQSGPWGAQGPSGAATAPRQMASSRWLQDAAQTPTNTLGPPVGSASAGQSAARVRRPDKVKQRCRSGQASRAQHSVVSQRGCHRSRGQQVERYSADGQTDAAHGSSGHCASTGTRASRHALTVVDAAHSVEPLQVPLELGQSGAGSPTACRAASRAGAVCSRPDLWDCSVRLGEPRHDSRCRSTQRRATKLQTALAGRNQGNWQPNAGVHPHQVKGRANVDSGCGNDPQLLASSSLRLSRCAGKCSAEAHHATMTGSKVIV